VPNSASSVPAEVGACRYRLVGSTGKGVPGTYATIGGMCLVYTGDLESIRKGVVPDTGERITSARQVVGWVYRALPRVDQIIDSVGPSGNATTAVVFEDNMFAQLLAGASGFDDSASVLLFEETMRGMGESSVPKINAWLSASAGRDVRIKPVYTSDIWPQIKAQVRELAKETSAELLSRRQAPVDLMYTSRWGELLRGEGYIEEPNVMCIEPFRHFQERASQQTGTPPYLTGYFRRNPWGGEGTNSNFVAVGYMPMLRSVAAEVEKAKIKSGGTTPTKFSRYLPAQLALSESDLMEWQKTPDSDSPFPLRRNPAFRGSIELLYASQEARSLVFELMDIERAYREEKKSAKGAEKTSIRERYSQEASAGLEWLSGKATEVYKKVMGGGYERY